MHIEITELRRLHNGTNLLRYTIDGENAATFAPRWLQTDDDARDWLACSLAGIDAATIPANVFTPMQCAWLRSTRKERGISARLVGRNGRLTLHATRGALQLLIDEAEWEMGELEPLISGDENDIDNDAYFTHAELCGLRTTLTDLLSLNPPDVYEVGELMRVTGASNNVVQIRRHLRPLAGDLDAVTILLAMRPTHRRDTNTKTDSNTQGETI